jgi:hypothetical protein
MAYDFIDEAHDVLVRTVASHTKPGAAPIPITLVSANDGIQGQLIVFDEEKFTKAEVTKRLRMAADFLDTQ